MATDTTTVLSASDISALMADVKERGAHEREVRAFVASEQLYCYFNELLRYKLKTPEQLKALKGQLSKIAKENELPVRFVQPEDNQLLAVNTAVHAEQLASSADDES